MLEMTFEQFNERRLAWEALGDRLMSREEVADFDAFFADAEESGAYQHEGFTRALAGDFSQFETVEPMMKAYLGAKKCYELFDRFGGDASNPELQQEIKARLMEADLRTGFALGGKDTDERVSGFLKQCERVANRQMMLQTLEEPDPTAKLRLRNQLQREDPATAQQKMDAALSKDLEQRVEMAKMLFLNHLGKFQINKGQQSVEPDENMAEIYTHGGRTMFILPAGANQKPVMNAIKGERSEQTSGLKKRRFATHAIKPRTFNRNGEIASDAEELKVKGPSAYAPRQHKGMHVAAGGLGHVGPHGKVITSDGTNGHMYMHLVEGKENTCGMMLVGFENSGPGKKGRLGHVHDKSAKKGGSSAFLSDKSYQGNEYGGRVVDLSGLQGEELANLLTQFEIGYRNAALAAQAGNPALLDACNDLLTGKLMSVGQVKGLLDGLKVPQDQIESVERARAGHPRVDGYNPIEAQANPAVPMQVSENPQKRAVNVTEFDGLVRPEPPEVMKAPSRWEKFVHTITFHSKNSYVSKYEEYKRTLPERINEYKERLRDYHDTLAALKRGENPRGLKEAYDQAVRQAKAMFGNAEEMNEVSQGEKVAGANVKPTSKEVAEQLENTLLNMIFREKIPDSVEKNPKVNQRADFRRRVRETESYQKLIASGEENVSRVINDSEQMKKVFSEVTKGILEKANLLGKNPANVAPQKNMEQIVKPAEKGPMKLS